MDHRPHRVGALREGVAAIDADAGPNQVVGEVLSDQGPRAVGQAGRRLGQARAHQVESLALPGIQLMRRLVGAGEMADDERDLEGVEQLPPSGEMADLARRQAKAVEPGIEMEAGLRLDLPGETELGPFLDLVEAGQRRPEAVRKINGGKAGEETIENVDDGVRQDGAELDAFG